VTLEEAAPVFPHFLSPVYTAKRVAAAELIVHKGRTAKFSRKTMEIKGKYLFDDSITASLIDYMQNLSLPATPVQEIFYQTAYSLCFHYS
jgi:hypothetical protein